MNIFVGDLAREVTNAELRTMFEAFGQVTSATVIRDNLSGESRGFGFVDMPMTSQAQAAIAGLQGMPLKGRTLQVSVARPRADVSGRRRRPEEARRS